MTIEEAWKILDLVCYTHEGDEAWDAFVIIKELVQNLQAITNQEEGETT